MVTTTAMMSAEDLWHMSATDQKQELWEGQLVEMELADPEHGGITAHLAAGLWSHAKERHLGAVLATTGYILERNPDTVFGPDVSVVRAERIPASGLPERYWDGPPDLAVEVRSPYDTAAEISRKVAIYLRAGTRLVWVVDPARQQVTVHSAGAAPRSLAAHDVLDGGDVLPGFQAPVAELFDLGL